MLSPGLAAFSALAAICAPAWADGLEVPSGQSVTLHETILDHPAPDMAIYRFRFLAPSIARGAGTMEFEASANDIKHLCDTYALQHLTAPLPAVVQVIISFSDQVVPFGETNPDATQFFMAFDIKDGRCVLVPF